MNDAQLQAVSERILNSNFGLTIVHSEEVKNLTSSMKTIDDDNDSLDHHGIKGMKWGVRRTPEQLGHKTWRRRRDRKYDDESPQEYQARMKRESEERIAKTQRKMLKDQMKYEAAAHKRELKSHKRELESQEKIAKTEAKVGKAELAKSKKKSDTFRNQKDAVKHMTDQELNDAINRLRKEKEYLEMTKEPDGFLTATLKKASSIGGGILVNTGKSVVTKQLTKMADEYLDERRKKKRGNQTNSGNPPGLPAHSSS